VREIEAQFANLSSTTKPLPVRLSEITNPDKALALFRDRRSKGAEANSKFDSGNHYQDGAGYIGATPVPGEAGYSQTMAQIRDGFVSENVIKEIVDRHIAGLLGREPLWGFLPADAPRPDAERRRKLFSKLVNAVRDTVTRTTDGSADKVAQEADEALTAAWWNTRKVRKAIKTAVRTALLEERATVRFFFPKGLRDDKGQIAAQKDLTTAVTIPKVEVLTCDRAGVFVDEPTQQEFGVYVYKTDDEKNVAEITYVQDGVTVLRIMTEGAEVQNYTFELGGRLLMYEIERSALITEQIRSLQKSLNLTRTMMVRNVNLAGSLERVIMNAEKPEEWTSGPGAVMGLVGLLIRNEAGDVINRANPNIQFRDPVSTENFTKTRDDLYAAMLGGCQQRFALISGDATASGKSRVEARSEFESSLKDSKDATDDLGRWLLETELRLSGIFCNRKDFLPLRCDFNAVIETGPITPQERDANRNDVKANLMSAETAMSRNGIDDTDAELDRIDSEPKPTMPPPQPGQGDQPPLIG
jgi:hypothetical protein